MKIKSIAFAAALASTFTLSFAAAAFAATDAAVQSPASSGSAVQSPALSGSAVQSNATGSAVLPRSTGSAIKPGGATDSAVQSPVSSGSAVLPGSTGSAVLPGSTGSAIKPGGATDSAVQSPASSGSAVQSNATGTSVVTGHAIIPTMDFTGAPVKLSLNQSIKLMQTTGAGAQAAQINKKAAESISRNYEEGYLSAVGLLKNAGSPSDMIDTGSLDTEKQLSKVGREYAQLQGPADFQAEMNKLESDAISAYYGLLVAQDNLKIAEDNLKSEEQILSLTKKKLQLGLVAKKDVTAAETAVITAKNDVAAAQSAVKSAKMNFNFMLGHPLMQEIALTDQLRQVTAPAISLEDAIKSALENRGEIRAAEFGVKAQQIALDNVIGRYPEDSATYQKAYVALLQAQKKAKDAYPMIEMEIRDHYLSLTNKENAIESAKANLDHAKEMYRLANISYDAGKTTLSEVQQAQIGAYRAALSLSKAITDYDLAVYDFNHAIGAGTQRML